MSLTSIYNNNQTYLTVTRKEIYSIINYKKEYINESNKCTLGKFRSVIMRDNNIVCVSPGKTYELNRFLNEKSKYKIEEYIEGLMINCFYDNDEWHIATYNTIDNETICAQFRKIFNEENWNLMKKTNTYTFILQDPSLELINNKVSKVYLINIFHIPTETVVYDIKDHSLNGVMIPNEIDISLDESIKKYCNINSDYTIKGLILKSNDNVRTKIRNSSFEHYKYILNSNAIKQIFDYCYFSKNKDIKKFIQLYGFTSLCMIKKSYYNLTYQIYLTYRNIYIHKIDRIENYRGYKRNVLVKLHNNYINILMYNKKYITKKYVIEYINNLSIYNKFMILSNIDLFYNRLNKLRI